MRRTVRLVESPLELCREKGRNIIRDKAAGYSRELEITELTRLAEKAATLIHLHVLCEGRIPRRKAAD